MAKEESSSPPVVNPRTKAVSISSRVVAGILEKHSPHNRLTHDVGFHGKQITKIERTSDGRYIFTLGLDGMVRMWDIRTGESIRSFEYRGSMITRFLITPNNALMITSNYRDEKRVWDLKTGNCIRDLDNEPGEPVFCTNSQIFCIDNSISRRIYHRKRPDPGTNRITVHGIFSGNPIHVVEIDNSIIKDMRVGPDNNVIAVRCNNGTVRTWDLSSKKLIFTSRPDYGWSSIFAFTPDERHIVLKPEDNRFHIQSIAGGDPRTIPIESPTNWSRYALIGFHLFHLRMDRESLSTETQVIDIKTGSTIQTHALTGFIDPHSITRDGKYCLGYREKAIDVWDLARRRVVKSLDADISSPAFYSVPNVSSPRAFVISRHESTMHIMSHSSKRPASATGNEKVRDLVVTPDGNGLIVMTGTEVRHWDLATLAIIGRLRNPGLEAPKNRPSPPLMALTPDGKYIVLPSAKGAHLRTLSTGKKVRDIPFNFHAAMSRSFGPVSLSLRVTPDGKRLLVASTVHGILGSYDLDTGNASAGFSFQPAGGFDIVCAGGGSIFTAVFGIVSRWDDRTGELLDRVEQPFRVQHMAHLPSLNKLAVSSWTGLHFLDCGKNGLLTEKKGEEAKTIMKVLTRSSKWIYPLPDERRLLLQYKDCTGLWNIESGDFLWKHEGEGKNPVIKAVVFPDGKRLAQIDTTGRLEIRGIAKGETLASLTVFPDRFVWQTAPDTHAPSGWLWTDREDLVTVVSHTKGDRETKVFRSGDNEHRAYMKIYNNSRMVAARISGRNAYRDQLGLYASTMDEAKAHLTSANESPARITAGEKGETR